MKRFFLLYVLIVIAPSYCFSQDRSGYYNGYYVGDESRGIYHVIENDNSCISDKNCSVVSSECGGCPFYETIRAELVEDYQTKKSDFCKNYSKISGEECAPLTMAGNPVGSYCDSVTKKCAFKFREIGFSE